MNLLLARILAASFFWGIGGNLSWFFLNFHLQAIGFNKVQIGYANAAPAVAAVLFSIPLAFLIPRLGYVRSLRLVVLPQAARIAVPPTVGFLVQLIKGTALASIVGFVELTRAGQILNNMTFKPFLIYVIVASIYFAICAPLSMWSRALEARLKTPYRR